MLKINIPTIDGLHIRISWMSKRLGVQKAGCPLAGKWISTSSLVANLIISRSEFCTFLVMPLGMETKLNHFEMRTLPA